MFGTLEIRHYRPVCDVSETGLMSQGSLMPNIQYDLSWMSYKGITLVAIVI